MINMNKTETVTNWVCPVVSVENELDELAFELPDELIEALDLKVGDALIWTDNKDGTFSLSKK